MRLVEFEIGRAQQGQAQRRDRDDKKPHRTLDFHEAAEGISRG